MFIYTQLVIQQDQVDVELTETSFPNKKLRLEEVALKKGDGTFVVYKDNKLEVAE